MARRTAHVKNSEQYEALKKKGMKKERAARIANGSGASRREGEAQEAGASKSSARQGGTHAQKVAAGRKGGKARAEAQP
jgi:hypothetical protein